LDNTKFDMSLHDLMASSVLQPEAKSLYGIQSLNEVLSAQRFSLRPAKHVSHVTGERVV
jgi:hypothetical protein